MVLLFTKIHASHTIGTTNEIFGKRNVDTIFAILREIGFVAFSTINGFITNLEFFSHKCIVGVPAISYSASISAILAEISFRYQIAIFYVPYFVRVVTVNERGIIDGE